MLLPRRPGLSQRTSQEERKPDSMGELDSNIHAGTRKRRATGPAERSEDAPSLGTQLQGRVASLGCGPCRNAGEGAAQARGPCQVAAERVRLSPGALICPSIRLEQRLPAPHALTLSRECTPGPQSTRGGRQASGLRAQSFRRRRRRQAGANSHRHTRLSAQSTDLARPPGLRRPRTSHRERRRLDVWLHLTCEEAGGNLQSEVPRQSQTNTKENRRKGKAEG